MSGVTRSYIRSIRWKSTAQSVLPGAAAVMFVVFQFLFSGCATVRNYEGKQDVGFQHHQPKFYLVVTKAKDGASQISVLTLPDLAKPKQTIRHRPGWGSVEFSFKLSNGVLTEYNSKADSKGPETLAGVASLGTAYGAILTAEAAGGVEATLAQDGGATVDTLVEIAELVEKAATELRKPRTDVLDALAGRLDGSASFIENLAPLQSGDVFVALEQKRTALRKVLSEVKEDDETLGALLETEPRPDGMTVAAISAARQQLKSAIDRANAFLAAARSDVRIYEIDFKGDRLVFKPVDLP